MAAPHRQDPGYRAAAVTPSDADDLGNVRAIYVGTGGDLTIVAAGDADPVTFANVQGGTLLPVQARKVMAAGTDASDIVAVY